ncbi:MAG: YfbU family protein [Bacteroidota bacterium]|jgi:uncharacterized protein YfbU (UPF0304 family)
MELTSSERLILTNQYRILSILDPANILKYKQTIEVLTNGFEREYFHYPFSEIQEDEDAMSVDECKEIFDIICMFISLKESYDFLEDKSGIKRELINFLGFDEEKESKQLAYTRYLSSIPNLINMEILSRIDNFNSQIPLLPRYRKMYEKYSMISLSDDYRLTETGEELLSKDMINVIINS